MDARLTPLLDRAFDRAPAAEANAAITRIRDARSEDGAQATSYEALLPEQDPVRGALETLLPRLVYFVECRGAKLPRCPDVFVSLFAGDTVYFLETEAALEELSRLSGLSYAELSRRHGERTTRLS